MPQKQPTLRRARPLAVSLTVIAMAGLTGCSSIGKMFDGDEVDYRKQSGSVADLVVPPDLSQLSAEQGFVRENTPIGGAVTLAGPGAQTPAAPGAARATPAVTPAVVGDARLMGQGNLQWVQTSLTPAQTWTALRQFWSDAGFELAVDQPAIGLMETQWKEDRTKIPEDFIRRSIGRFFDSLYSTGQRDKFVVRVEPAPGGGSAVYLTHKGMQEADNSNIVSQADRVVWVPSPRNPQIETEYLRRVLLKLGGGKDVQQAQPVQSDDRGRAAAQPQTLPSGQSGVVLNQPPAQAWRVVGLNIDRSFWQMQSRDEAQGTYSVTPPVEEKGFLSGLFSKDKSLLPKGAQATVRVGPGQIASQAVVTVDARASDGSPVSPELQLRLLQDLFPKE
ncbi:outer membrane protein assembly factor BamC [Amphibiibacter pelophylacis]|uniref:Outer membrane protein assembly factor BamC n=1 Tax=Amphibiibacter pelophylacis TaxID=1799477 RepID=A0ACC6P0F4_9BURK